MTASNEDAIARRAVVRGRVQGVFFRASTQERANSTDVTGWVRNDPDGTVTIHAEGDPDAVESLIDWAHDGPQHARVAGVDVHDADVEGHDEFVVSL